MTQRLLTSMDARIKYNRAARPGLVTVVIPARNRDELIGATLESVRSQTYANWEVVVVEDASKGETERIVREFGKSVENQVTYVRNRKQLGAAETRNVAFRLARGHYVATLDSDDLWLPEHLQTMIDGMESSNSDIGYARVQMFADGTDADLGVYGPSEEEVDGFPKTLFNRCFIVPSATVMRRSVFELVGPQSGGYLYCEDFDFFLRCVSAGLSFIHIDKVTCRYRKNHAGATTERLSGTLEEVAYTIVRYANSPAADRRTTRDFAYRNFLIASKLHRRSDPSKDPSSDPMQGGRLLIEAWRIRPAKLGPLARGIAVCLREWIVRIWNPYEDRSRHRPTVCRQPIPKSHYKSPVENKAA